MFLCVSARIPLSLACWPFLVPHSLSSSHSSFCAAVRSSGREHGEEIQDSLFQRLLVILETLHDILLILVTTNNLQVCEHARVVCSSCFLCFFSFLFWQKRVSSSLGACVQVMDPEALTLGTDSVGITLNKLRHELEHLSEPANPICVGTFLERKRTFFFRKLILVLHNFIDTMLSKGHMVGVRLVQSLVNALVTEQPSNRQIQTLASPLFQVCSFFFL